MGTNMMRWLLVLTSFHKLVDRLAETSGMGGGPGMETLKSLHFGGGLRRCFQKHPFCSGPWSADLSFIRNPAVAASEMKDVRPEATGRARVPTPSQSPNRWAFYEMT